MNILSKAYIIIGKLGGKRFLIALGTLLAIMLHSYFGISEEAVNTMTKWAAGLICGDQVLNWATKNAWSSQSFAAKHAP